MRRTLGERLKEARLAARFTQSDVAAEFQRSRQAISSWEQGKTLPDLIELRGLATLYGVSTDAILFGVEVADVCTSALAKASALSSACQGCTRLVADGL